MERCGPAEVPQITFERKTCMFGTGPSENHSKSIIIILFHGTWNVTFTIPTKIISQHLFANLSALHWKVSPFPLFFMYYSRPLSDIKDRYESGIDLLIWVSVWKQISHFLKMLTLLWIHGWANTSGGRTFMRNSTMWWVVAALENDVSDTSSEYSQWCSTDKESFLPASWSNLLTLFKYTHASANPGSGFISLANPGAAPVGPRSAKH